jgi:hypothetical protein
MSKQAAYQILCLDPKIPDLPPGQLEKLHEYKDKLLDAYNNAIVGENAIDPSILLPLTAVHAAAWNQVNFRNSDPKSIQVAQTLMDAAQANCDLHVKYKKPKSK